MSTYVIGDVQGCARTLEALLKKCAFSASDRIIFLGDLVNRGSGSLAVTEFVLAHRTQVQSVLGNHDLHARACYLGLRKPKRKDTLGALLESSLAEDWFDWSRSVPLTLREAGHWLVHAGFHPHWNDALIATLSEELGETLADEGSAQALIAEYYRARPAAQWEELEGLPRLSAALQVMLGVRVIDQATCWPDWSFVDQPTNAPETSIPWYEAEHRWTGPVAFGHWAAHGLRVDSNLKALDTGCVWGGSLTAWRVEDNVIIQQESLEA